MITAVLAACRTNYRPHLEQAIDEAMVVHHEAVPTDEAGETDLGACRQP